MLIWFAISLAPAMSHPVLAQLRAHHRLVAGPVCLQWHSDGRTGAICDAPIPSRITFYVLRHHSRSHLQRRLTARDYFLEWPDGDCVRFWQQTTWTQAARTLDADPSTLPVAASGLSIQDADPQTFDLLLDRRDVKVKWFDCRSAILYPEAAARYHRPISSVRRRSVGALPAGRGGRSPAALADSGSVIFTLHQFDPEVVLGSLQRAPPRESIMPTRQASTLRRRQMDSSLQRSARSGRLAALGWEMGKDEWRRGEIVKLESAWKVTAPLAPPLKLFITSRDPTGRSPHSSTGWT
jgi:hypothetical protein